jgi:cytochrome c
MSSGFRPDRAYLERRRDFGYSRRDRIVIAAFLIAVALGAAGYGGVRWQEHREEVLRSASALTRGGDPDRGRDAIQRYGCGGCHTIKGIPNARGLVGPPLDGIAGRVYLAGIALNTPDNMIAWIRDPRAMDEKTAMPNTGVTRDDARDIAAFLYTLR